MSRYVRVVTMTSWKQSRSSKQGGRSSQRGATPKRPPARAHRAQHPQRPADPDFIQDTIPEDDDPEPEGELGASRLRDKVPSFWGPHVDLGPNLRVQARRGFRVAVVEVKPGLFVMAEVPERSVEFGLGPLLLAPALVKTLGRAMKGSAGNQPGVQQQSASRPLLPWRQPAALPAPKPAERLARWLDDDIAAELGCAACREEG